MEDSQGRKRNIQGDIEYVQKMLFGDAKNDATPESFKKSEASGESAGKVVEALKDTDEALQDASEKISELKDVIEDNKDISDDVKRELQMVLDYTEKSIEQSKKSVSSINKLNKTIKEASNITSLQNNRTTVPITDVAAGSYSIDVSAFKDAPASVATMVEKALVGGKGGGGSPPSGGGVPPIPPDNDPEKASAMAVAIAERNKKDRDEFYNKLSNQLASYAALGTGGASLGQIIFSGGADDATVFRKEMRMIGYEIEGINASTRGMQAEFTNLGNQIVAQTGKEVGELQQAYLRNIKKGMSLQKGGIKDQKQVLKVLKSGLNLSTMIGSDSTQTADTFADWSRNLGLSSDQMSRLALDAKNVARSTGVTGDELIEAMKSSENILTNLRNQGNLTSSAMQNVIKGAAEAQKLGVGPAFNKVMDALSSTNKFFFEADDKTKSFLFNMADRLGKFDEMAAGTFTQSRSNMKSMGEGMLKMLGDMTQNFGVNQIKDWGDLQKLTTEQRRALAIDLKNTTGMEITEFERLAQVTTEMGKGLGDTLDDLSKKMNHSAATAEERALAQKSYDEAIINSGRSLMNDISENIMKSGGSLEGYLSTLEAKAKEGDKTAETALKDFNADAEAIAKTMGRSIQGMSDMEKIQMVSVAAAEKLQKAAASQGVQVEDFSTALKTAISSGDEQSFREITAKMTEAQQKVGVTEKTSSDPIEQVSQSLKTTNEYLRKLTSGILGRVIDSLGGLGLTLFAVGASMASLGLKFSSFGEGFGKQAFELLPKEFQQAISGMAQRATGSMSGFFKPLVDGFFRFREAGMGVLPSLSNGISRFFMSFGKFGKGFLGIFNKLPGAMGPLAAAASVISGIIFGIIGAFQGFQRTGENFKAFISDAEGGMKELTVGMYISSTAAGGLVGILNGLTFGILGFIGVAKPLEFLLANIINLVAGLVEGLVDGVMYAFRMIQPTINYIGKQFQNIGNAILRVFNSIFSIFGAEAGSLGDVFVVLYRAIRMVGQAIGMIVGVPLGAILWVVARAFSAIMVGVEILANIIAGAVEVVSRFVRAIWSLITLDFGGFAENIGGIFTGLFSIITGIFSPIGNFLYDTFSPLIDFFWGLGRAIMSPFVWLYTELVGNSIVPDLVFGIIKFFAMLPINIMKSLLGIPKLIVSTFSAIPSLIGDALSGIGNYLMSFGNSNIFGSIISQLGNIINFIGNIFSNFAKGVKSIFKIFEGIFTLDFSKIWEGIKGLGGAILGQLSNVGSFLYNTFVNAISGVGNILYSVFVTFPSWLLESMISGLSSLGSMILSGIKSVFIDFPSWLLSKITSGLSNLGSVIVSGVGDALKAVFIDFPKWLYEQFTGALSKVWDYIKSWIPGMKTAENAVAGYSETSEQQAKTMSKEGPSTGHALGGLAGAGADLLQLDVSEAASKAGLALKEGVYAAGDNLKIAAESAWGGVKAVGSYLNPFNYFQEGTRQIEQPGLAMLHQGEMVIPADLTNKISAEGSGPFEKRKPTDVTDSEISSGITRYGPNHPLKMDKSNTLAASSPVINIESAADSLDSMNKIQMDPIAVLNQTLKITNEYLREIVKNGLAESSVGNLMGAAAGGFLGSSMAASTIVDIDLDENSLYNEIKDSFKFTKKLSGNIKKYAGSAFSGIENYFSDMFLPLTKGFTRSMKAGEGIFSALSRGINGQIMSITKGKSISEIAGSAFSSIQNLVPDSIKNYASSAFSSMQNLIPDSIKNYASSAFSGMGAYFSSAFSPMISGFTRSMKAGEGIFSALSRGITGQYMSMTKGKSIPEIAGSAFERIKNTVPEYITKYASSAFSKIQSLVPDNIKNYASSAFSGMSGYFSKAFSPMISGFTRSMKAGEGIFSALSRGINGQIMSITKGKSISEIAGSAFSNIQNLVPDSIKNYASSAFSRIQSLVPDSIKNYASSAFSGMSGYFSKTFSPMISGFTRSMKAGEGIFSALSRGITGQYMSMTKGKPLSEIASSVFEKIKDQGSKAFSKIQNITSNIFKSAKEKGGGLIEKAKGFAGIKQDQSKIPGTDGVKNAVDAGNKVKGNFENVKQALSNLAEGIKSFANKDVLLGALNLIPTGVGLTAMIPGFVGAKLLEKISGEKISESLSGLSRGLSQMANKQVLLGSGALLLTSLALLAMLPALPTLAILGAMSALITTGLTALSVGLTTFGTAAANPLLWIGIAALGALGIAMIPFGYALSTLSPLVVAFGSAINAAFQGIGSIITSIASGMTMFLGAVSIEKAAGLVAVAGGLTILSAAILGFSVATAAAGWVSFFGGDGIINKIMDLAAAGPNLKIFADSIVSMSTGIKEFANQMSELGGLEKNVDKFIKISNKLSDSSGIKILEMFKLSQISSTGIETGKNKSPMMFDMDVFSKELKSVFIDMPMWLGGIMATGLKSVFVDMPMWLGGVIISGLSSIFIDLPIWLGKMLLPGLKSIFVDFPVWLGGVLVDGLKSIFVDFPVWLGKVLASGLKYIFVDMPMWLGGIIASGLKSVFVDLPMWLGGMLISGIKSIFVDLPMWLGGIIASGLKSIFIDLPVWLMSTIIGGITSLMGAIPGAIYNALYWAASKVGLGWVVKSLAGGGGGNSKEQTTSTAGKEQGGLISKASSAVSNAAASAWGGVKSVGSTVANAASGAWEGLKGFFGFGEKENSLESILPLMSEFYKAGISGSGILIRQAEKAISDNNVTENKINSSQSSNYIGKEPKSLLEEYSTLSKEDIAAGNRFSPYSYRSQGIGRPFRKEMDQDAIKQNLLADQMANKTRTIYPSQSSHYAQGPMSIEEGLNNTALSIEQKHAIPTVRPLDMEEPTPGVDVQPVHLRDISQTILRDKAASQPTGGKLQSDELTRMEEASIRQVEELEQIKEGIQELVALMKPTGRGSQISGYSNQVAGSTRDPRRPMHSATFGKMKYGKPGGNANNSIINNGEV